VRDAFYRLSKLGFLLIRPQRATTVSSISEVAVLRARFVREALELATVRIACEKLTEADFEDLDALLDRQAAAIAEKQPQIFHDLDDQFHREICERTDHGFAWDIIRENKAHMDRVRFLSLSFARQEAYDDHRLIFDAIRRRDADTAVLRMSTHLSRIKDIIGRIRSEHESYFEGEQARK
jgi:DNA-binding GntR family transcriptional regulator